MMRKKDREIKDIAEIEDILSNAKVCRLGLIDDEGPYIVPLSFGYREGVIFFHSAKVGKKITLLKKNGNVSFEVDIDCEVKEAEKACGWSMNYRSVIGRGRASFIDEPEAKKEALNVIMHHYSGKEFDYPNDKLKITEVIRVDIVEMKGKIHL